MKDITGLLNQEVKEEMKRKIERCEIVNDWEYKSAKRYIERSKTPPFQVGDIVCRRIGTTEWDCVPSTNIPKRFLVSYIDDNGMVYAFKICTRKNLGRVLHCITSDSTYDYYLDPIYVECSLTGKNYLEVHNGLFKTRR
jgi:hypothetical protein